ncbi:MAG: hypothetical protein AB7V62_04475 [Thermoleophilia bacterium]
MSRTGERSESFILTIDASPLPDLQQILRAIEPGVQGLEWRLLDLREAVQPEPPSDELERIIEAADQAEEGLVSDFGGLLRFADLCEQIVDGLFVGLRPGTKPPGRSDTDDRILEVSEVVVAVLDSSFWLVAGPDTVLASARHAFPTATEVETGSVVLSTWGRA